MSPLRAYYELCKPRVIMLMLLTAIVGMLIAAPSLAPWQVLVFGTIGIALAASSGGVLNQLIDRHFDAKMGRTKNRPLPSGQLTPKQAIVFATTIGSLGLAILALLINPLTALLTFLTVMGYGIIYTVFLKHATPQNIVIGGLAGAMPPMLGWTAVTGQIDAASFILVLIIYTWTPPHFWALAIARYEDYQKTQIPMLPITHGIAFTKLSILLYTVLLIAATLMPFAIHMSGFIYLIGAGILNSIFLYWVLRLYFSDDKKVAYKTFFYSIVYLGLLFVFLLVDHYVA